MFFKVEYKNFSTMISNVPELRQNLKIYRDKIQNPIYHNTVDEIVNGSPSTHQYIQGVYVTKFLEKDYKRLSRAKKSYFALIGEGYRIYKNASEYQHIYAPNIFKCGHNPFQVKTFAFQYEEVWISFNDGFDNENLFFRVR